MNNIIIIFMLFVASVSGNVYAGTNSSYSTIRAIEGRESGSHAIYLNGTIPDQTCTHSDRAIITEDGYGAQTLIRLAITALQNRWTVQIYVDGCTLLNPGNSANTAPKITKIRVL